MAKPNKENTSSKSYLRYTGMSMQMLVLLFAAVWLGGKIDTYLEFEVRYLTALLVIVTLVAFFIKLYYDLLRND